MCWKKLSGLHSHIEHAQIEMALECIQKKLERIEAILKKHAHNAEDDHHYPHHHDEHDEHAESYKIDSCSSCSDDK